MIISCLTVYIGAFYFALMRFNYFLKLYNYIIIVIVIIIVIIIYFQNCPEDLQVKSKYVRRSII